MGIIGPPRKGVAAAISYAAAEKHKNNRLHLPHLVLCKRQFATEKKTNEDQAIECWVKDTGEGIPRDRLERVFERFETNGPRERRGIGLGLSIVKEIVELEPGLAGAERELAWCEATLLIIHED